MGGVAVVDHKAKPCVERLCAVGALHIKLDGEALLARTRLEATQDLRAYAAAAEIWGDHDVHDANMGLGVSNNETTNGQIAMNNHFVPKLWVLGQVLPPRFVLQFQQRMWAATKAGKLARICGGEQLAGKVMVVAAGRPQLKLRKLCCIKAIDHHCVFSICSPKSQAA